MAEDPLDRAVVTRVLKELNEVAEEAARMEQVLEAARDAELRPRLADRRGGERRHGDRRVADRRESD
jgi:hypothetical protein